VRSLFATILLWFLATVAVTIAGFTIIAAISFDRADRPAFFPRLVEFQLQEARRFYETEGRDGLAAFMNRFRRSFEGDAALTDARGIDLLTGENRGELLRTSRPGRRRLFYRRNRAVIAHPSEDRQYWLILFLARERVAWWSFLPQQLWVIAAVVLLCWVLAYHLTSPVRRMQKVAEHFSVGDFSARVHSRRKDELGQLARTLDAMAGRIQTLLAAERRLLGDISHELRSPLARLGVAVELARSGANRDAALDRIQKESDRLNALVGELLQVTRAEADPAAGRFDPVALDGLLGSIAEDAQVEAGARGSRVELSPPPPVTVRGDPELLRRAIENIVRNAVRYAPHGSAVELALHAADNSARISVRDFGPGVPEEALPQIFNPFYRVESDRDRASGGAGLGLSIAKRAVELHGGALTARNVSPGLLVEIVLPRSGHGGAK
jgi:two-component system sensor histidine kinase CpxA